MKKLILCLFLLLTFSCSKKPEKSFSVALDPSWPSQNFGTLNMYVNGYIDDLLLEIATLENMEIEKLEMGVDSLVEGLERGQFNAALTYLPETSYNEAKFTFSDTFLQTGPILVLREDSKIEKMKDLERGIVGTTLEEDAEILFRDQKEVRIQEFGSIPDALTSLLNGSITAALLDRLPSESFVFDLFHGKLRLIQTSLSKEGLHALTLRGEDKVFIERFNEALYTLKKSGKLQSLQKKWGLSH